MLLSKPLLAVFAMLSLLLRLDPCQARATGNVDSQPLLSKRVWGFHFGQEKIHSVAEEAYQAAGQLQGLHLADAPAPALEHAAPRAEPVQPTTRSAAQEHPSSSYSGGKGSSRWYKDIPGYYNPYGQDDPFAAHRVHANTPGHLVDQENGKTLAETGASLYTAVNTEPNSAMQVEQLRWAERKSRGVPDAASRIVHAFGPAQAILRIEADVDRAAALRRNRLEEEGLDRPYHDYWLGTHSPAYYLELERERELEQLSEFKTKLAFRRNMIGFPEGELGAFTDRVVSALDQFIKQAKAKRNEQRPHDISPGML